MHHALTVWGIAGTEAGKPAPLLAEGSPRADNEAARASSLYQLLITTQARRQKQPWPQNPVHGCSELCACSRGSYELFKPFPVQVCQPILVLGSC